MAALVFAEHNRVNWVGVKPARIGYQIVKDALVTTAFATTIWKVPANRTGFLCTLIISPRGDFVGTWSVHYEDYEGTIIAVLIEGAEIASDKDSPIVCTFNPPLELTDFEEIAAIGSSSQSLRVSCFGWEE